MDQQNNMPSTSPMPNAPQEPNPSRAPDVQTTSSVKPRGPQWPKNLIIAVVAVLVILVTGALIFTGGMGMSKDAVAKQTLDYINKNLLQPGQTATLEEVVSESGVVKLKIKVGGQSIDSYVTKDGKLFFTSAIKIEGQPGSGNGTATGTTKVSMDDDAVLGNKDAPVTIIEFSDYECPFCKRHFEQVHPELQKNYINTGKVKLVFRDFVAVQSHNPLATSEAMAAECAREQGGDTAYFKYHDELFKRTTSNGNGLALTQLAVIAKDLGLNGTLLQTCLNANKYKEEFNKDNADALAALPANDAGTPSFFIGKSTPDGVIDGTIIKGAQPYSAFQAVIDGLLK